jgi:hypothetical protein
MGACSVHATARRRAALRVLAECRAAERPGSPAAARAGGTGATLQQHCCAQLGLSRQQEFGITAVAAHSRPTTWADPSRQLQHDQRQQGAAAALGSPSASGSPSGSSSSGSRTCLGLSVATTLDDRLVASAWAQKDLASSLAPSSSSPSSPSSSSSAARGVRLLGPVSWGVGLQTQPEAGAPSIGVHLGSEAGWVRRAFPDCWRCSGARLLCCAWR